MTPTPQAALQGRMHWLREETKRISNVTLAGNFTNPEDRAYWADRLKKLSGELSVLEHQTKPKRITKVDMTNQTQSALLSDGEVAQCINRASTNLFDRAGTTSFRIARATEQAVLAKLQPAQSIPPGLRVGDSHMESLIEAAIQGHAGTRDAMRWLVRQIARVEDKPAQAGELPDEREALIDDLAKWEMRVRRYVTASPSRPLSAKGIDMTHPEFNVAEWRKHSILHNIIVKLFCRHKHTTEIAAIEHEHLGDKQPYNRFWMPAVVVEKCCRCGHISAQHVWTTRDRSPGAVARAMGFLE